VFVPSSELAPPTPLPQASVSHPLGTRGGGGEPIRANAEKAWHSVYIIAKTNHFHEEKSTAAAAVVRAWRRIFGHVAKYISSASRL
jgi:hypothetical protein